MKIQVDENNYLTGSYCNVGNIDNSIEMASLPEGPAVYYPAYQILSREVFKVITVDEEVVKQREIDVPTLDENGNPTGETHKEIENYTVIEPVERTIAVIEYYYEFDAVRKQSIDDAIEENANKPKEETSAEKIARLEGLLDDYGLTILRLQGIIL